MRNNDENEDPAAGGRDVFALLKSMVLGAVDRQGIPFAVSFVLAAEILTGARPQGQMLAVAELAGQFHCSEEHVILALRGLAGLELVRLSDDGRSAEVLAPPAVDL